MVTIQLEPAVIVAFIGGAATGYLARYLIGMAKEAESHIQEKTETTRWDG